METTLKKSSDNSGLAFLIGMLFTAALFLIAITTEEEFIAFCKAFKQKYGTQKPLEDMTIKELEEMEVACVGKREYEKAASIKKVLDYKKKQSEK